MAIALEGNTDLMIATLFGKTFSGICHPASNDTYATPDAAVAATKALLRMNAGMAQEPWRAVEA